MHIQRQRGWFELACRSRMERIGWVHQQFNRLQARYGLLEEPRAFAENIETHTKSQSGHVPATPRKALDKATCDWIGNGNRHDRYRAGGLARSYSCLRGQCDDDVHLLIDRAPPPARQSVEVDVCIAEFDGKVATLDMAEVFKVLAKGLQVFRGSRGIG